MSVKPVPASSVLPPVLREPGNKPPDHNRFAVLMERARTPSVSGKTLTPVPAQKRPSTSDDAGPAGKSIRMDNNRIFFVMENVERMLIKGKDDVDKVRRVLAADKDLPPVAKEIFGGMLSAFDNITDAFEAMASVVVDSAKHGPQHTAPKGPGNKQTPPAPSPEEQKKNKFSQTVRDAEKTILVHKIDLGKVPIMNTGTMSRCVTQDIVKKAASVENSTTGRPSEEVVAVLDDTLSMISGMEFLGKVTKPYSNRFNDKDPENGTFHTLPVKLSFKSKEAKQRAEKVFKKQCKIQCSTPYPKRLRQAIGELIKDEKTKNIGCFIQVKVDLEAMELKVSRRSDDGWVNDYRSVKIDTRIMDTETVKNTPSL
jgi:hypothetical protein